MKSHGWEGPSMMYTAGTGSCACTCRSIADCELQKSKAASPIYVAWRNPLIRSAQSSEIRRGQGGLRQVTYETPRVVVNFFLHYQAKANSLYQS